MYFMTVNILEYTHKNHSNLLTDKTQKIEFRPTFKAHSFRKNVLIDF